MMSVNHPFLGFRNWEDAPSLHGVASAVPCSTGDAPLLKGPVPMFLGGFLPEAVDAAQVGYWKVCC